MTKQLPTLWDAEGSIPSTNKCLMEDIWENDSLFSSNSYFSPLSLLL